MDSIRPNRNAAMTQRRPGWGRWLQLVLAAGLLWGVRAGAGENEADWVKSSLVSAGDSARLQKFFAKARRGESVTVAVMGGSITGGAKASKWEYSYANQLVQWWQKTFPQAKIKFINAGVGATGSNYGALRARRDLLGQNPDFVLLEFAVNDDSAAKSAETMEGLTRQILVQTNQPAVLMLFMVRSDGSSAQQWHAQVGAHYALPMVSYRDALWPPLQAGQLKWAEVGADMVHPNDRGHAFAAKCVIALLENTLKTLPADALLPAIKPLPAPLFSDLWERTALFEGEALRPVANAGWRYDPKVKGWVSDQPGSSIEFELEGRVLYSMNFVTNGAMGKASVTVDGVAGQELNGWFDQTWGGYRQLNEILRQPQSDKHRIRFELLTDQSPGSTGHRFEILGLGAAGLPNHQISDLTSLPKIAGSNLKPVPQPTVIGFTASAGYTSGNLSGQKNWTAYIGSPTDWQVNTNGNCSATVSANAANYASVDYALGTPLSNGYSGWADFSFTVGSVAASALNVVAFSVLDSANGYKGPNFELKAQPAGGFSMDIYNPAALTGGWSNTGLGASSLGITNATGTGTSANLRWSFTTTPAGGGTNWTTVLMLTNLTTGQLVGSTTETWTAAPGQGLASHVFMASGVLSTLSGSLSVNQIAFGTLSGDLINFNAAGGSANGGLGRQTSWNGYERLDFTVGGRAALLVRPKSAAPGTPWIWRTEFFGHEPQADIALLGKGFHVAYIDVQNLYGAPVALAAMDQFYDHLTGAFGLSKKPVLEGMSRGGLFAFNWAARHPDQVAGLYVDAPVCDFKSWPGGKGVGPGSPGDWQNLLKAYGFTEAQALAYDKNPVDNLAPLAQAHVPIFAVIGSADEVVPVSENIDVVEKRYLALGGNIQVIRKPGNKHHPHSLKDPTPIVDFALRAVAIAQQAPAEGFTVEASGTPMEALKETPAQRDARMQWWNEARFGMFIHWGLYSVPADGEWILENKKIPVSQYEQFAQQFNPVKFDAKAWVRAAKHAGMKYIVITSKHHDGFDLYPSALSDWGLKRTPFQRDPLKELADACAAEGITFCLYHSIMDWHHPDWGQRRPWNDTAGTAAPDMDRYTAYLKGQLNELLTGYGKIGVLWFDGQWEKCWSRERGEDLYNYVRNLQPGIIVNNRTGGRGDYDTPEQKIPATGYGPGVYWESCGTMNDHWGYSKSDHNWKSTETLVRNLIDCTSKGGNYLLNVGPTAEGLFPDASLERLQQIGDWMKVNGEAIYGTTASPFRSLAWGRCTKKVSGNETTLYLHVFDWPTDGKLVVPGLKNGVTSARLLAGDQELSFTRAEDGVTVTVPDAAPDKISSTVVLKITGAPVVNSAVRIVLEADGSVQLQASAAELHGALRFDGGTDCIGWWMNPADTASWTFKVSQPGKFKLTADLAAEKSGKFEVLVGGQKLSGAVPATGSYTEFKTVDLAGELELARPGSVTLTVQPVAAGWSPMNLRSLKLQPK